MNNLKTQLVKQRKEAIENVQVIVPILEKQKINAQRMLEQSKESLLKSSVIKSRSDKIRVTKFYKEQAKKSDEYYEQQIKDEKQKASRILKYVNDSE